MLDQVFVQGIIRRAADACLPTALICWSGAVLQAATQPTQVHQDWIGANDQLQGKSPLEVVDWVSWQKQILLVFSLFTDGIHPCHLQTPPLQLTARPSRRWNALGMTLVLLSVELKMLRWWSMLI